MSKNEISVDSLKGQVMPDMLVAKPIIDDQYNQLMDHMICYNNDYIPIYFLRKGRKNRKIDYSKLDFPHLIGNVISIKENQVIIIPSKISLTNDFYKSLKPIIDTDLKDPVVKFVWTSATNVVAFLTGKDIIENKEYSDQIQETINFVKSIIR